MTRKPVRETAVEGTLQNKGEGGCPPKKEEGVDCQTTCSLPKSTWLTGPEFGILYEQDLQLNRKVLKWQTAVFL